MYNYSYLIITFSFLLLIIYLIHHGYHTFIKSLQISFYIYLFIKLIILFLTIFLIDFNNFKSILSYQFNINLNTIFIALFISFLCLIIKYICNYKISLNMLFIINPIFIKLLSIGILGNTLFNIYYYPYINILKHIKYLDFIERMEGILSLEYFITFYFLSSFFLLYIKTFLQKKKA